ncbi:unnamed protein product, partial [Dicrocoelium dendriticum]
MAIDAPSLVTFHQSVGRLRHLHFQTSSSTFFSPHEFVAGFPITCGCAFSLSAFSPSVLPNNNRSSLSALSLYLFSILSRVDEALNLAERMLGHRIYTVQTGEAGQTCNTLLVCERKYSRREHYFAIVLDRELGGPVMLGCEQGGVDIEGLARDQPDTLIKMPIDIDAGLSREEAVQMAIKLNFTTPDLVQQGATYIERLYKLFSETDCSLLEINPIAQDIHDQ